MDDVKAQLVDKLKSATNILVTVSRDPSVDQLASCIGLTLLLNKQGKHAAAVFSGAVPSTLEFLKPEETIEKTTDSLRDFIISLDKAKADKLRYKVEDNVVRIFITPYRTSINENDLAFTQGDFNVDAVVALGVHLQEDLDQAITAHGRILHDATVASINIKDEGGLGTINWNDPQASSLCELVTDLATVMGENDLLDGQIATALLTGIVAETERFSNEKTGAQTMTASAALMAAGANQQLVASELATATNLGAPIQSVDSSDAPTDPDTPPIPSPDGLLEIEHNPGNETPDSTTEDTTVPTEDTPADQIVPDGQTPPSLELPNPDPLAVPEPPDEPSPTISKISPGSRMIMQPPSLGGQLTANTEQEGLDPGVDPFGIPSGAPSPLFSHPAEPASPAPELAAPAAAFTPPPPAWVPPQMTPEPMTIEPAIITPDPAPVADLTLAPDPAAAPTASPPADPSPTPVNDDQTIAPTAPPSPANSESFVTDEVANHTLAQMEESLDSPHLDAARDEVNRALNASDAPLPSPEPAQALGAQPLGEELHAPLPAADSAAADATNPGPFLDDILGRQPATAAPAASDPASTTSGPPNALDPNAPPPVPPPIPFQFGTPAA